MKAKMLNALSLAGLLMGGHAFADAQLSSFAPDSNLEIICQTYNSMLKDYKQNEQMEMSATSERTKSFFRKWKEDTGVRILARAQVEAGTGQAIVRGPARLRLNTDKTEFAGGTLAKAIVQVPGFSAVDGVIDLPNNGSYSLIFNATVAGLCPLADSGDIKFAARRLLESLLK